jgi:hypothetical protein
MLKAVAVNPLNLFAQNDFTSHVSGYNINCTRMEDGQIKNLRQRINKFLPGNILSSVYARWDIGCDLVTTATFFKGEYKYGEYKY